MRFFKIVGAAMATLITTSEGCLVASGYYKPSNYLSLKLVDNLRTVCWFNGAADLGTGAWLSCVGGHYSWVKKTTYLGGVIPPKWEVAYAHSGTDYRFNLGTSNSVSGNTIIQTNLFASNYGC